MELDKLKGITKEAIEKELCERSFYHFVKQAWSTVESNPYTDGEHIKLICDALQSTVEDIGQTLLINIPPRCSKSLITCVFFPVWCWIKHPHIKFLTASYAMDLATRDAVKSRRIIQSQWYQGRWGDRFQLADDQNQKQKYENDKGGHRIVCSPGAATTGEGGDILICDDPLNAADSHSAAKLAEVQNWWNESFYNRLNNPASGSRIVIGQRLSTGDLFAHILETNACKHICLPAEYDPRLATHSWTDYSDEGDLLCPNRLSAEVLEDYKHRGSAYYASQYQQSPTPPGGAIVKTDWLHYYHQLPDKFDSVIQSWDLSFGTNPKTSDFVVGLVLGRKGPNIYVIDMVRGRWDFLQQVREIRRLSSLYPQATTKLIEQAANGAAAIATLRGELQEITPIKPSKSKLDRLNAVLDLIECDLYLPANAKWLDDFVFELTSFSGTSKDSHDDIVDALTQGLSRLRTSASAGVVQYLYV